MNFQGDPECALIADHPAARVEMCAVLSASPKPMSPSTIDELHSKAVRGRLRRVVDSTKAAQFSLLCIQSVFSRCAVQWNHTFV